MANDQNEVDYSALAAQSSREAVVLGQTMRDGSLEKMKEVFRTAMTREAYSIEKDKKTTLAAIFAVDYISIVLNPKKFSEEKQKLFASLVLGDIDTLAEVFRIGSVEHLVSRLGKLVDPAPNASSLAAEARKRKDQIDKSRG